MARIRTIKPEFPQSESIGRLSRDARLLFIQLWTVVDDHGRFRAAPRLIAGLLYPYDDDAPSLIMGWMAELAREGCIRLYEVDGDRYLDIPNWAKHQRIDNAGKSKLPEFRGEIPRTAASLGDPPLDLGPRTIGPRKDSEANASGADAPCPPAETLAPEQPADPRATIFREGLRWLAKASGRPESSLRSMIGKWIKARGDPEVCAAIVAAQQANIVQPIAWIETRLNANARRKPSDLDRRQELAGAFRFVADQSQRRQ